VNKKFFSVLQKELEIVTVAPLTVTDDLRPPESLNQITHKLTDIMKTFSRSVVTEERREEEFSMVLSAIVDPLLQTLHKTLQARLLYVTYYATNQTVMKKLTTRFHICTFSLSMHILQFTVQLYHTVLLLKRWNKSWQK
jgi:hypothetical protein